MDPVNWLSWTYLRGRNPGRRHHLVIVLNYASPARYLKSDFGKPLIRLQDSNDVQWAGSGSCIASILDPGQTLVVPENSVCTNSIKTEKCIFLLTIQVRALVSANNSSETFDLRCYIREGLLNFVKDKYPASLPLLRIGSSWSLTHTINRNLAFII